MDSLSFFSRFSLCFIYTSLLSLGSLTFAKASPLVIPEVSLQAGQVKRKDAFQLETTHISRLSIENSGTLRLDDLLKQEQSVARIESHSGDSTQTAVSLRGFGDNAAANSLILIDGFPLTNPSLLTPNFNSLLLADIERIDIFQGSKGTLWGDQAVGGVVNIITRHPKKGTAAAKIAEGSDQTQFYSLLLGNKLANGMFVKLAGYSNQTHHYRQHNQQLDQGIFPQAGIDYSRGSLEIRLQAIAQTIQFPGGLTEEQYSENPRQAANFSNFSRTKTEGFQLLSKHEMTPHWILETRISHQSITGDGVIGLPFDRDEGMTTISPRLMGMIHNNKIVLGLDKQYQYYQFANKLGQKTANAEQNNLYAQIVIPLYSQIDLTLGGRLAAQNNQFHEKTGKVTHPINRVAVTEQALSFQPHPDWQFFIRRDGNFRFPKLNEGLWHPASVTSLEVQKGVSYETGVTWQKPAQKIQFNVYRLTLNNEIAFDPNQTPMEPFGSFHPFDQTLRHGATLANQYQLNSLLNIKAQLNYVHAKFSKGSYSGKWIPAVPQWNGNLGAEYQLNPRWLLNYTALYTGSRFASEDVENLGKKSPSYWLNNLTLQYSLKRVKISFTVENITDKRYTVYTLYKPATGSNTYYPGAGRSYLLTLDANILS